MLRFAEARAYQRDEYGQKRGYSRDGEREGLQKRRGGENKHVAAYIVCAVQMYARVSRRAYTPLTTLMRVHFSIT